MRLGVAAALVAGRLVPGDVSVAAGRLERVGLARPGRGLAVPGLVDLQVNGYGGVDLATADEEGVLEAARALARSGVTSFQPTLVSAQPAALERALRVLDRARARAEPAAARLLGAHLEGPFLAPAYAGAHDPAALAAPEPRLLERLLGAGEVAFVTLAPELPGSLELVAVLAARGVCVSLGHSGASAAQAHAAFAGGAQAVTHCFNAMAPLAAREPGLAGAALTSAGVAVLLIADGVHVAPELLVLACRAAPGRVVLTSDAVSAAGCGDGTYLLGGQPVEVRGGVARTPGGRLAGSTAGLAQGVRTLAAHGVALVAAVGAATAAPARLLGLARAGLLEPGGPADLAVLDAELGVERVLVGGVEVER